MKIWITTDWHLWSVEDTRHPYKSDNQLQEWFNKMSSKISEDDILIVLGDVCDPAVAKLDKLETYIRNIPGYKMLCLGNHDTLSKDQYKSFGFDSVSEGVVLDNIIFTHKPIYVPENIINIHGHLHNRVMVNDWSTRHINAYTESGIPVELADILDTATSNRCDTNNRFTRKEMRSVEKAFSTIDKEYVTDIVDISEMVRNGIDGHPIDETMNRMPDHIEFNRELWKAGTSHNVLFITGLSGSGKTTLGLKMAKENGALYINLDHFTSVCRRGPTRLAEQLKDNKWEDLKILKAYFTEFPDGYIPDGHKYSGLNEVPRDIVGEYYLKFSNWLRTTLHDGNYRNSLYVVEGLHIYEFESAELYANEPVIIKSANSLTALIRREKRGMKIAKEQNPDITNLELILGTVKDSINFAIPMYIKQAPKINKFRNNMITYNKSQSFSESIDDVSYGLDEVTITLSEKRKLAKERNVPVFICLFHFSSVLSTVIAAVTKDEYTHSAISFDTSLTDMYSFGKFYPNNPVIGRFVHESLFGPTYNQVTKHAIYAVFVTPEEKQAIKDKLDWFIENKGKMRYNYEGLLRSLLKIPEDDTVTKYAYLCSEFVASILKSTGRDFISTPSNLVKPNDFQSYPWCYYLGAGIGRAYDQKAVDRRLAEIIEERNRGNELYLESVAFSDVKKDIKPNPDQYKLQLALNETSDSDQPKEKLVIPVFRDIYDFSYWMKSNIRYKTFDKLIAPVDTVRLKKGSCHDQVILEYQVLKQMGYAPKILFFMEYREDSDVGGRTHTTIYCTNPSDKRDTSIYWFENAWGREAGVKKFDTLEELKAAIEKSHADEPEAKQFPKLEFRNVSPSKMKIGSNLKDLVSDIMNESTEPIVNDDGEELDLTAHEPFFEPTDRYKVINADVNSYLFELADPNEKLFFPDMITESADDNKLYPVYIMLMHSGTTLANIIKKVTKSNFSHSSISFDASMTKMYSFGRKFDSNPFIGTFRSENIRSQFFTGKDIPFALYMVPATKSEIAAMKRRLEFFTKNATKFKYDFTGLFKNYLGIADNPEYKYFCSRFVADILNAGRPSEKPYVVEPSLMKPEDFAHTTFAQYVTGGSLDMYDPIFVENITKRLLREEQIRRAALNKVNECVFDIPYSVYQKEIISYQCASLDEAAFDKFVDYLKSFKVKFNKNGDVIITRREYDNLEHHFKNSLKMIKACESSGNVEGVKSELCKIHYMIQLISEHYLTVKYKTQTNTKVDIAKKMIDLRSVMLNAFKQHLAYVTVREPRFNFQEYYNNSDYGKNLTIPKNVVSNVGKSIITLLK